MHLPIRSTIFIVCVGRASTLNAAQTYDFLNSCFIGAYEVPRIVQIVANEPGAKPPPWFQIKIQVVLKEKAMENQHLNNKKNLTLADFNEQSREKQAILEEQLAGARLEDTLSPLYFIQNVNATIIGF